MRKIKKEQLDFLSWEMGAFFHFGIRTFYEGHKDWDLQDMPAEAFNPTSLDCTQWISTIKQAGMKYAVLVCKHHDGFANWPSAYTEYSVKNTPWKDGKGDVVQEFVDACRKYGIKVGLYYSPAQFGSEQQNSKSYDDYFINQLSELLCNYGKIDYLWFDGCGSENHTYDTVRIVKEIRRMQPDILIFNMWDPDTRWAGNEAGYVSLPNKNVVSELDFSVQTKEKTAIETRFLPGECDCRLRRLNWYYSDSDQDTVKSVDELMGMYYCSVGRGANLLLNISPDRRGLLPEADAERVIEFGNRIRECFDIPLPAVCEKTESGYSLSFSEPILINHVVILENMEDAEKIEEFSVYANPYPHGKPVMMVSGSSVGHKRILCFPSIYTQKIDVVIQKESGPSKIDGLYAYYIQ